MKVKEYFFSQEELLYLLRTLNLPDLPGMGENPWGHIPQEQVLLIMESVGRGLVARKIARFGDVQMEIDGDVAEFLSSCAYPIQMSILTYDKDGKTISKIHYHRNKRFFEHTIPYPWVHCFTIISKSDLGLDLVKSLLAKAPRGETSNVFQIHQGVLSRIRASSHEGTLSARSQLREIGLKDSLVEKCVRALTSPTIKVLLQAVYNLRDPVQQNMISILADNKSCWLISAGRFDQETVQLMQVDRKKLDEVVTAIFLPFAKVPKTESSRLPHGKRVHDFAKDKNQ